MTGYHERYLVTAQVEFKGAQRQGKTGQVPTMNQFRIEPFRFEGM